MLGLGLVCAIHAQEEPEDSVIIFKSPVVDTLHWGPQSGHVSWSLKRHGLVWETARLKLELDPWVTFRHVMGTLGSPTIEPSESFEPWDNLRGAHFRARLDEVWHVSGSLEEMQGQPSAWDVCTMESLTALPGWGRAKVTTSGRVDVARSRLVLHHRTTTNRKDTLTWTSAYAPFKWGNLPSSLTFSPRASSFPRAGLTWQRPNKLSMGMHVGRWTGTERSELGGSTESLFRQTDVAWGVTTWHPIQKVSIGFLYGCARQRPWSNESINDNDSAFAWTPGMSVVGHWTLDEGPWGVAAEWSLNQGIGSSILFMGMKGLQGAISCSYLSRPNQLQQVWRNAGTPVAAAIRPDALSLGAVRTELHGTWQWSDFSIHGRGMHVAGLTVAETCVGYLIQKAWPLHVTAGVEFWTGLDSSFLPNEGMRFRVGLAHQLSMTPGSPTFALP